MSHGLEYPKCGSLDCFECRQRSEAILATYGVSLGDFWNGLDKRKKIAKGRSAAPLREKAVSEGNDPNLRLCGFCEAPLPALNRRRKFCNDACRENAR